MTDIIKSDKVTNLVDFQRPISLRQVKLRSMKTLMTDIIGTDMRSVKTLNDRCR